MAQILVTVNEDIATQSIRKAIEMIKGVVSTTIYKQGEKEMTKRQQEILAAGKELLEPIFMSQLPELLKNYKEREKEI